MHSLLFLSCALLVADARADSAALATTYTRSNVCDDGIARPKGVVCAHVPAPADAACPEKGQVMALLHGCYFCVDGATCLLGVVSLSTDKPSETSAAPIPTATASHKVAGSSIAMAKASNNVRSPATGTGLAGASQNHVDSAGGWTSHLSNWAFVAPVAALALVGVGVAARKLSASKRGPEFERLQEEETDEINPFCASALAQDSDDGELELVDEEQKEEETEEEDNDEEDCDDDGPDIVVARLILDDIDEEEEDEACL